MMLRHMHFQRSIFLCFANGVLHKNLIIVLLTINITFPNNLGATGITPSPNEDESQASDESMVEEVHGECGSISIRCPVCTCTYSQSHVKTHVLSAIISLFP